MRRSRGNEHWCLGKRHLYQRGTHHADSALTLPKVTGKLHKTLLPPQTRALRGMNQFLSPESPRRTPVNPPMPPRGGKPAGRDRTVQKKPMELGCGHEWIHHSWICCWSKKQFPWEGTTEHPMDTGTSPLMGAALSSLPFTLPGRPTKWKPTPPWQEFPR